jgi:branched-subunit amino acid transport protein
MDATASGPLWPYLLLLLLGVLPTAPWRVLAVIFSRRLVEDSEILHWVKFVATALLAGIVAKLVMTPSGALAGTPLAWRIAAPAAGVAVYFLARRSVLVGVVAGEAVLIAATWLAG